MNFSTYYNYMKILENDTGEHIPTKDELRHFNQARSGGKIDYSQDFHNKVLQNFYRITIRINDEKLRKSFADIIFRNMGNLKELIEQVKRKNLMNVNSNKYEELSRYISKIEGEK